MKWGDERGGVFAKVLGFGLLGIIVIAVATTMSGGGSGDDKNDKPAVTEVQIPGEATIEDGDEKTITRITGVSTRGEAIPGNEFSKAGDGKTYILFATEIENVGTKDLDLNSSVYRLKLPSGEIVDYSPTLAEGDLGFGIGTTLTPGAKKAAQLTWEIPVPAGGDTFVLLWKPNPFNDDQAQFTYNHT